MVLCGVKSSEARAVKSPKHKRGVHPGLKYTGCVFGDCMCSRTEMPCANIPARLCVLAFWGVF